MKTHEEPEIYVYNVRSDYVKDYSIYINDLRIYEYYIYNLYKN